VKNSHFVQSMIALITKILAAASVLILNAIITRVLSLSDTGSYLTLNAFVLFWVMASANGIPQILMRWVALRKAKGSYHDIERNITQGMLLLLLAGGLSTCCVLLLWREPLPGAPTTKMAVLVIVWICLGLVLRVLGEAYRGLGSAGVANLVTAVNSHGVLVTLVVASMLAVLNLQYAVDLVLITEIYIVVLAVVGGAVGWRLFSEIRLARNSNFPVEAPVKEELFSVKMLKNGLMLTITELSVYVMTQGDIWIVGRYASSSEVALYGVAARMAGLASLVLIAMNSVLPMRMAVCIHEGKKLELQKEIKRLVTLALMAALAWLVICLLAGGWLLGTAFGRDYAAAKYFLVILSLGHVINVATGPCGLLLLMHHRERDLVCGTLPVLAVYLACVFPMGRMYGAMGVAYCSAASYALVNVVYAILARKTTGINTGIIGF
jgi:O-antigen/teichoic acid export membrane protein